MIDPGKLNKKISIQRLIVENVNGSYIGDNWTSVITTFANIEPVNSHRQFELGKISQGKYFDIYIRYSKELLTDDTGHFVSLKDYKVIEYLDDENIKREMIIQTVDLTQDENYLKILAYEKS